MHIGQVVRLLRLGCGRTQEWLALEAGVATSHVSRIERGLRQPGGDLLRRLAQALGVSVSALHAASESGALRRVAERHEPMIACLLQGLDELTPDNLCRLLDYLELLRRRQRRGAGKDRGRAS